MDEDPLKPEPEERPGALFNCTLCSKVFKTDDAFQTHFIGQIQLFVSQMIFLEGGGVYLPMYINSGMYASKMLLIMIIENN